MSAVLSHASTTQTDVNLRLAFQKQLQQVTNKIHATSNIDEIMLDVSKDICALFNADRLTIYVVGEDRSSLISKVKTGLNSFKDLKLPIAEQSIAGYAAFNKKLLNLKDVYDEHELASYSTTLRFLQDVDRRTGYRTKQMLVAPIVDVEGGDLIGVMQVINNKAGSTAAIVVLTILAGGAGYAAYHLRGEAHGLGNQLEQVRSEQRSTTDALEKEKEELVDSLSDAQVYERADSVAAVMASYVLMVLFLVWIGVALRLGWPYYAGLAAAAGMMHYHYALIRDRSREGCFRAFRHNNWVGVAIFAGIALSYSL